MADVTTEEELLDALHKRMLETGYWTRLMVKLRGLLKATPYEDELSAYAHDQAQKQEKPDIEGLIRVLTPRAKEAVPPAVRETILVDIMAFLHDNLEIDA